MSYFEQRRAEILEGRKRKPRRCDLRRQKLRLNSERTKIRRVGYCFTALESVWC